MTTPTKNLAQKMAAVMMAAETVAKRGKNTHFKYDYATEADIVRAVRETLAHEGVAVVPAVVARELRGNVTVLTVEFTFTDGISSLKTVVIGEGQDGADKGAYKALTGATKYAILKTFLIPTGDDPEEHHDHAPAPPPRRAPTPVKAAKQAGQRAQLDHDAVTGEVHESTTTVNEAELEKAWLAAPNALAKAKVLQHVPPDVAGRIKARHHA
jgi:CBS domain-containing protein